MPLRSMPPCRLACPSLPLSQVDDTNWYMPAIYTSVSILLALGKCPFDDMQATLIGGLLTFLWHHVESSEVEEDVVPVVFEASEPSG